VGSSHTAVVQVSSIYHPVKSPVFGATARAGYPVLTTGGEPPRYTALLWRFVRLLCSSGTMCRYFRNRPDTPRRVRTCARHGREPFPPIDSSTIVPNRLAICLARIRLLYTSSRAFSTKWGVPTLPLYRSAVSTT